MIEPLGITLLATFLKSGNLPAIFGMIAFTGIGTGIRFMPGISYLSFPCPSRMPIDRDDQELFTV
jgi:hypothetical protein